MPFAAVHTHTKKTFISARFSKRKHISVDGNTVEPAVSDHPKSEHFNMQWAPTGGGRLRELNHSRDFFREVFLTDILFGREFIACIRNF